MPLVKLTERNIEVIEQAMREYNYTHTKLDIKDLNLMIDHVCAEVVHVMSDKNRTV